MSRIGRAPDREGRPVVVGRVGRGQARHPDRGLETDRIVLGLIRVFGSAALVHGHPPPPFPIETGVAGGTGRGRSKIIAAAPMGSSTALATCFSTIR